VGASLPPSQAPALAPEAAEALDALQRAIALDPRLFAAAVVDPAVAKVPGSREALGELHRQALARTKACSDAFDAAVAELRPAGLLDRHLTLVDQTRSALDEALAGEAYLALLEAGARAQAAVPQLIQGAREALAAGRSAATRSRARRIERAGTALARAQVEAQKASQDAKAQAEAAHAARLRAAKEAHFRRVDGADDDFWSFKRGLDLAPGRWALATFLLGSVGACGYNWGRYSAGAGAARIGKVLVLAFLVWVGLWLARKARLLGGERKAAEIRRAANIARTAEEEDAWRAREEAIAALPAREARAREEAERVGAEERAAAEAEHAAAEERAALAAAAIERAAAAARALPPAHP
jgi:hypothetical protein